MPPDAPEGEGSGPAGLGGAERDGSGSQTDNPWQRELMDLPQGRGEDGTDAMRTVAEWFGEGRQSPGQGAPSVGEDVRQAVRGAQEAIERERVPRRRSDLIRRVFERYAEQLGRERSGGSSGDGGGGS